MVIKNYYKKSCFVLILFNIQHLLLLKVTEIFGEYILLAIPAKSPVK